MTAVAAQQPTIGVRVLGADGAAASASAIEVRWRAFPELPGLIGRSLGGDGVAELSAKTDERGRVSIAVPTNGPFEVTALSAGLRSRPKFPVMAGDFVDLQLRPAFQVGGVVKAGNGEPIGGAELVAVPNPTSWGRLAAYRMPEARAAAVTAADGTFALDWHEGYLQAPLWEPFVSLQLRDGRLLRHENELLKPTQRCQQLELTVGEAVEERGRIVQADGTPAVGARVFDLARPWLETRTDREGAFVFTAASAMLTTYGVRHEGHALAMFVRGGTAGRATPYPIELAHAAERSVAVVDELGQALPATEVLWVVHTPTIAHSLSHLPFEVPMRTDAGGRVAAPPVGPWHVVHLFVRCVDAWVFCGERPFAELATLERASVPVRRTVTGKVVAADQAPLPGVRIVLRTVALESPLEWVTYTDRRGEYTFVAAPAGEVAIVAEGGAHGFASRALDANAARCDLAFAIGDTVTVTLHDSDGQPVAGGWVSLVSNGGTANLPGFGSGMACVCALTGPDGVARFRGLPDVAWQVLGNFLRDGSVHAGGEQANSGQEVTVVARRSRG